MGQNEYLWSKRLMAFDGVSLSDINVRGDCRKKSDCIYVLANLALLST